MRTKIVAISNGENWTGTHNGQILILNVGWKRNSHASNVIRTVGSPVTSKKGYSLKAQLLHLGLLAHLLRLKKRMWALKGNVQIVVRLGISKQTKSATAIFIDIPLYFLPAVLSRHLIILSFTLSPLIDSGTSKC